MKPVDQNKFLSSVGSTESGNCLAACVASIFETSVDKVPNFAAIGEGWYDGLKAFVRSQGFSVLFFTRKAAEDGLIDLRELEEAGHYMICGGKSPRGDFLHAVVAHRGKIVHDPHPDRAGIETCVDYTIFLPNTLCR